MNMDILNRLKVIEEKAKDLMEENKDLKKWNHILHKQVEQEQEKVKQLHDDLAKDNDELVQHIIKLQPDKPHGFDFYVEDKLSRVAETPCVSYSKEVDDRSTSETLNLIDGTVITIERESN